MEESYIKMFRKLLKWEWADDPNMVALWLRLLLEANYKPTKWHGITIERGQLVLSMSALAKRTGVTNRNLRTCIQRLVDGEQIIKKSTNKFTILTICKYDEYQSFEQVERQTNDKQTTNKRQTNDKRTTTLKESKEREEREEDIFKSYTEDNSLSVSGSEEPSPTTDSIPWNEIVKFFNDTTKGMLGKLRLPFSDKRKGLVRARVNEYGLETFYDVIRKAAASRFLSGDNRKGWTASFDWIVRPTNFEKIMSGNYDNRNDDNADGFEERRQEARRNATYKPVTWENS